MQVQRTSTLRRRHRLKKNPLVLRPAPWRTGNSTKQPKLLSRKPGPRRIASILLLTTGAVLCAYVAGSYAWIYTEQRELLREWKAENTSAAPVGGLTKIAIPSIGLRAVVLEGTSAHSLLMGPAHMSGSAIPGAPGNAVIAGHRDTFFRNVHKLRTGDSIYILRNGKEFHYVVVRRKVVAPTDLSVLKVTKDKELTLITCYPTHVIGPAPLRLIIVAKMPSAHNPYGHST
jgi:sortase A